MSSRGTPRSDSLPAGMWATLEWLEDPRFGVIKQGFDDFFGPGAIYFRLSEHGLVPYLLDPAAPAMLPFQTGETDPALLLAPDQHAPPAQDLARRLACFRRWLSESDRHSATDQALMATLRQAQQGALRLPDLPGELALLASRWRFPQDPRRARVDLLALEPATGRLCMVAAIASARHLVSAMREAATYQQLWLAAAVELAPFLTRLARALGRLYGNAACQQATVMPEPARLLTAAPRREHAPGQGLKIVPLEQRSAARGAG